MFGPFGNPGVIIPVVAIICWSMNNLDKIRNG